MLACMRESQREIVRLSMGGSTIFSRAVEIGVAEIGGIGFFILFTE